MGKGVTTDTPVYELHTEIVSSSERAVTLGVFALYL